VNAKTLLILAAAAILLAVLAIVAQNGADTASIAGDAAGSKLLPSLETELDAIDQIAIDGAGDERLVTLDRAGDNWSVVEQDGYLAEFAKIRALAVALAEATVVEEKTANPEFHSRLGVEDISRDDASGLGVTLRTGSGEELAIVLGDTYGSNQRYARRAGEDQSFLIDRNPDVARASADWVVPGIVDIETARVQRVAITHRDGERVVIRKPSRDDANFTVDDVPEGRELQYASVANVTASAISDLRLEAVSRAADAPAEPAVEVEFLTFDGLALTATAEADEANPDAAPWLRFSARFDADQAAEFAVPDDDGGADGDDDTPNIAAEAEAINQRVDGWRYRIPSYQYDQITRRLEDLLQEPSEPDTAAE
jgi:hypothetical protein